MKKVLLLVAVIATVSAVGYSAANKTPKEFNAKTFQTVPASQAITQERASMRTDFSSLINQPKKANAALVAKYKRPAGALYVAGISPQGSMYYAYVLAQRPIYKSTYVNASTGATSYTWKYKNFSTTDSKYEWFTSTDKDLLYSGLWGGEADSIPQLTASDGTNSASYSTTAYLYDSSAKTWTAKSNGWVYFVASIDSIFGSGFGCSPKPFFYGSRDKAAGNGIMYYTGASDANGGTSGCWFGTNASGFDGIAVAVEKPEYPYAVTGARIFYRVDSVTKDFNLTVKAYKLVKPETWDTVKSSTGADSLYKRVAPVLGDLLATGTAVVPATTTAEETAGGRSGYAVAPFQVKNSDGTTEDVTLSINDPIIVTVSGYNCGSDYNFTTFITRDQVDEGHGEHAYLYYTKGSKWIGLTQFFTAGTFHTAPSVFLDCELPFVMFNYSNESGQYNAPNTGGSKKIQYFGSKSSDYWSFQLANGSDVPDWVTIAPADSLAADKSYSNLTNVTYTAAALPSGITGRTAKINVSMPGSIPCYYTIVQGDGGGVNDVNANVSKVSVVDGNFVVNAVANDVVRIYNIAGQFIKQAQVSQGQTVIDGQEYAKGIYVVKFQNGKSYKVAK